MNWKPYMKNNRNVMKKGKATNKQILDAYGQSYRLMQEAKRYDDNKNKSAKQKRKFERK